MRKYNHKVIEKKWQKQWEQEQLYQTLERSKKPRFYCLGMFPYPSGEGLHTGHPRSYTATDIVSRYRRMNGYNVLHPMGWDAFGLPAENFALKNRTTPQQSVKKNVQNFKRQIQRLGLSYDWSREINTTDPEYYRWTQWIFLQMYKAGLAYQSFEPINWCPSCQTGLANEDLEDGRCERCDSEVEQRPIRQWVLRITDYAEKLLDGLEDLDWPESIKELQRNWIGRSEGSYIDFPLALKRHFVLLHGYKSSSAMNFFPWLKRELESRGHTVEVPDLPNANAPDVEEQTEYVLQNCRFDRQTVLLGHSHGAAVAMLVAERLKQPINRLVLAGGFLRPRRPYRTDFNWQFNFDRIKNRVEQITVIKAEQDSFLPPIEADKLSEALGGRLVTLPVEGDHLTAAREPAVLSELLPQLKVFTTRPDTLFGATYMVVAPEHELITEVKGLISNKQEVNKYIKKAAKKTELQRTAEEKGKTGVELKGVKAVNPATQEEIPIFMADYVIRSYGTGAIMAVPAHDERDFEFAQKFKLPVRQVVRSPDQLVDLPFMDSGELVNSGQFSGLESVKAKMKITEFVGGQKAITYKLQDWVFSRQRYWGEPIPLIHCDSCGVVPVPEHELPVKLPKVKSYQPTGTGESPLAGIDRWVKTKCPTCNGPARRETNTMPQWAGSCWYYLAYPMHQKLFPASDAKAKWDKQSGQRWLPVDMYVGGVEHATRHLIYARFWHHFLYDQGLVQSQEPFESLRNQGMIYGEDNRKMSKRWGNVVNPDQVVEDLGADTMRTYEMFIGPFSQSAAWSVDNIMGIRRFLERVWRLRECVQNRAQTDNDDRVLLNRTIKQVGEDIEGFAFNTAVSALMILSNRLLERGTVSKSEYLTFLQLLAPFAPHMAEELWREHRKGSVHTSRWPKYDPAKLMTDQVTLAVQVNGKLRSELKLKRGVKQDQAVQLALQQSAVLRWIGSQEAIKRTIFVPDKLINFVV